MFLYRGNYHIENMDEREAGEDNDEDNGEDNDEETIRTITGGTRRTTSTRRGKKMRFSTSTRQAVDTNRCK